MREAIQSTIIKDEPEPGTLVVLTRDFPRSKGMGHKKGDIGRVVYAPHTYKTVIEFDYAVDGSTWYTERVEKGDYEIAELPKVKKLKLII